MAALARLHCLPADCEFDPGIRIDLMQALPEQCPADDAHVLLPRPERVDVNAVSIIIQPLFDNTPLGGLLLIVNLMFPLRLWSPDRRLHASLT